MKEDEDNQDKLTDQDRKEIAEKYKNGKNGLKLAEEYGVSDYTIYMTLEKMGVERKRR